MINKPENALRISCLLRNLNIIFWINIIPLLILQEKKHSIQKFLFLNPTRIRNEF